MIRWRPQRQRVGMTCPKVLLRLREYDAQRRGEKCHAPAQHGV